MAKILKKSRNETFSTLGHHHLGDDLVSTTFRFYFKIFKPLTASFIHLSLLEVSHVTLLVLVLLQDQRWKI